MKVLIIGAGIGGLGLAIALKREGIDAELYEKAPELTEAGAAISLFPNALHVLKGYGLLEAILKKSGAFGTVHVKNAKGISLSSVSPKYELPSVCIHRADLQKILLRAVDPAIIHCGDAFVKFEEDKEGITAFFESGRQVKADLLIGADGLRSKVREQIIGDGEPVYRGYTCWRGVAKLDSTNIPAGYGSESNGLGKRVGIVPIGDGRYGWWATNNEPENTPDGTDRKQHLLNLFGSWHFPISELIQHTDDILKNDIYDRIPVKGWSKGRAVLLGDAAHPTTPNLGQGGCMALEDGPVLAKCLSKYNPLKIAFERYETLRFERTKAITAQSLLHGKLGQLSNPAGAAIRDFSFRLIPARLAMKTLDRFFGYKADEVEC